MAELDLMVRCACVWFWVTLLLGPVVGRFIAEGRGFEIEGDVPPPRKRKRKDGV